MMRVIVEQKPDWRILMGWAAVLFILARTIIPVDMQAHMGLTEISICSSHGTQTVLVDQNMNRVDPGVANQECDHCGPCAMVFALAWAIALSLSLAIFTPLILRWRDGTARRPGFAYNAAIPRAPPLFS